MIRTSTRTGMVTSHAIELAVGEHPEQARLELGRHVSNLVEEQRAAVGLLETAEAPGLGAGECAAFVAEQLGFQQLAGNRRGVECDERRRCPRTMTMQRPRDEFLAGARLAGDQHRQVRSGEPADRAKHLLHRGGGGR